MPWVNITNVMKEATNNVTYTLGMHLREVKKKGDLVYMMRN